MSEREPDSTWSIVLAVFLIMILIAFIVVKFKSDIGSLQRRVSTLEQQSK